MRIKKAGFLTKIVVLVLLIYMATSLLDLRGQLQANREEENTLVAKVAALTQKNAQLSNAIDNKDDPEVLEDVARGKGFVKAGEKLFIDVAS